MDYGTNKEVCEKAPDSEGNGLNTIFILFIFFVVLWIECKLYDGRCYPKAPKCTDFGTNEVLCKDYTANGLLPDSFNFFLVL
jgi:hypothetical protein